MVNRRSSTSSSRGVSKVRRARAVVMVLLTLVAVAIIFIDKKEDKENVIEIAENAQTSTKESSSEETVSNATVTMHGPSEEKMNLSASPSMSSNAITIKPKENKIAAEHGPVLDLKKPKPVLRRQISRKMTRRRNNLIASRPSRRESRTRISRRTRARKGYHIVQSGETLSSIALKYYGNPNLWLAIQRENKMRSKVLKLGQQLKIPSVTKVSRWLRRRRRSPRFHRRMPRFVASATGEAVCSRSPVRGKYYIVARGENLSIIAKRAKVSFLSLLDKNSKVLKQNPNRLRVGMKLWIPRH